MDISPNLYNNLILRSSSLHSNHLDTITTILIKLDFHLKIKSQALAIIQVIAIRPSNHLNHQISNLVLNKYLNLKIFKMRVLLVRKLHQLGILISFMIP